MHALPQKPQTTVGAPIHGRFYLGSSKYLDLHQTLFFFFIHEYACFAIEVFFSPKMPSFCFTVDFDVVNDRGADEVRPWSCRLTVVRVFRSKIEGISSLKHACL